MSGIEHFSEGKSVADDIAPHLVAIAFSAAGLEPLQTTLRGLTPAFPACVVVVHHVREKSELASILRHDLQLNVKLARRGDVLVSGTVLVCPAGHDIFVKPDRTVGLSAAQPAPYRRPADWLFESTAAVFGRCGVAVVLSGRLCDGARGVRWMKRVGGRVIVQHPSTCGYPSMPTAAIDTGCVDLALEPAAIAPMLRTLVTENNAAAAFDEWESPFSDPR